MSKGNSGLTLVEVLVFVGIIVVAVLVIMPAIQRAQEEKRKSLCQDTLRRWGQAFSMYADEDPEQKFPPIQMVNRIKMQEEPGSVDCIEPHFVPQLELLYPDFIDDLGILYCPSDPEAEDDMAKISKGGLEWLFDPSNVPDFSYLYLGWAFDRLGVEPAKKLNEFPILNGLVQAPLPPEIRDIETVYVTPQFAGGLEALFSSLFEGGGKSLPGEYFLHLADSDVRVTAPLGNNGVDTIHRLGKGVERFLVTDQNDTNAVKECASKIGTMMDAYGGNGYMMYFNHIPGGSNVLFMDGHVEFVRYVGGMPGPNMDDGATAPVLPGMAPIVGYISDMGSGILIQTLMKKADVSE